MSQTEKRKRKEIEPGKKRTNESLFHFCSREKERGEGGMGHKALRHQHPAMAATSNNFRK